MIPGLGTITKRIGKALAKNGGPENTILGGIGKTGAFIAKGATKGFQKTADIAAKIIGKTETVADGRSIFEMGKDIGKAAGKTVGKAGSYVAAEAGAQMNYAHFFGQQLTGKAPFTSAMLGTNHPVTKFMKATAPLMRDPDQRNLIGYKLTGIGKGLVIGGAIMAGAKDATVQFNNSRVGSNDGMVYNNSLQANSQGNTWQSMQHNYLNNAGATGDLGFALHDLHHSKYY